MYKFLDNDYVDDDEHYVMAIPHTNILVRRVTNQG